MFFRTTKDEKHTHVAYLNRNTRSGATSLDKGHSHVITYQQPTPPQIGPDGAMLPDSPGGYMLEPATDGHSHSIAVAIQPKESKKSDTGKKLAEKCRHLFLAARELEADFRKNGEEAEDFYYGEQWKKEDKGKLEGEDRAALTFNEIEAKIDLLSGYQRQNRFDIKFFPTEEGDARVADILSLVSKNIDEQCKADHEETKVFEDAMLPGRGVFHEFIDYDEDPRGTIKSERFPWPDVWFGEHEKEDLSDCEHAHKARWFSKAKLKQLWPDKADDIDVYFDIYDKGSSHTQYPVNQYDHATDKVPVFAADPDFINMARKEMRVFETTFKEYERVTVLVNAQDDLYFSASGWESKDITAVKTIPGFSTIPRNVTRFRVVSWACGTLLEDSYSDLDDFSLVPVYAKKRGKRIWGKVKAAIDPQKEINKRRSQVTDILNKVATYGYFYDDDTFPDEKEAAKFKKNVTKPGFTQKVTSVDRKPVKEEGVKFPGEIVNMITLDSNMMREILNINMEMQGTDGGGNLSGVAIAQKKHSGLVGNEFLFDNLSFSKWKRGRLRIKMIQKIYTPERILRLIENQAAKQEVNIAGVPWAEIDRQEIMRLLTDSDLSKYDVVVGESAYSPTMRLANFAMFAELAAKGAQLPPQMLIELSPLPQVEKEKALQQIAAQMQQMQAQEQQKFDTELQKTLIAKGMPPGGLPGQQGPM